MILHAESEGSGAAVVILHGLMGSCENWRRVRKALADRYRVICLDLPNHGRSSHMRDFNLKSIAAQVLATLDNLSVTRVVVVGHSLGGKVAMQMASDHADRLAGLVVVDISPRAFKPVHLFVLRACQALDLASASRRSDLDQKLATSIPQEDTRAFLLKNVVRDSAGRFCWRVPLQTLIDTCRVVSDAPALQRPYAGPSLFVVAADAALIHAWFPVAQLVTIAGAGHLIHTEKPALFISHVRAFLDHLGSWS